MDKVKFNPVIYAAEISMEFDTIILEGLPGLPANFKDNYEFHDSLRYKTNGLIKVKLDIVKKLPSLFIHNMKDIGCNIRYKRTKDVEHYGFIDIKGNLKPIALSYDIRKKLCRVFWVKGGEKLWVHPPGDKGFHHPFFNGWYDMVLYSAILSHHRGFWLHAVGASKKEGEGILVCGHSRDGKSTLAQRLNDLGYEVISDDCLAIQKTHKGFCFFPTPWRYTWRWRGNPFKYTEGTFFSSVFFLTRYTEKQSEIRPLSKKEVFLKLYEYILFYLPLKEKVLSYLELCLGITAQVRGFQLLHSLKDESDPIKLIERLNNK